MENHMEVSEKLESILVCDQSCSTSVYLSNKEAKF